MVFGARTSAETLRASHKRSAASIARVSRVPTAQGLAGAAGCVLPAAPAAAPWEVESAAADRLEAKEAGSRDAAAETRSTVARQHATASVSSRCSEPSAPSPARRGIESPSAITACRAALASIAPGGDPRPRCPALASVGPTGRRAFLAAAALLPGSSESELLLGRELLGERRAAPHRASEERRGSSPGEQALAGATALMGGVGSSSPPLL